MSFTEAVIRVTARKPLAKKEIMTEITKLGHKFATKDPVNSLNAVIYGKRPGLKNKDGRFSLKER